MSLLTLLVGPPGSGKSTLANSLINDDGDHGAATVYVNQDTQSKFGHMEVFRNALANGQHIIVDRMNFNKQQRATYISLAKEKGYRVKIRVLHQPYAVCLQRAIARQNHPTIQDEKSARAALQTFFTKYERPQPDEADEIEFIYPEGLKSKVIVCDLDGTLCDVEHRRHFVRRPEGEKKDWHGFFLGIKDDPVIPQCADLLRAMSYTHKIVYCSGRPDNYRKLTEEWLWANNLGNFYDEHMDWNQVPPLFMRPRNDSRQDDIVKEIILDFEILTRYVPYFMIDDRDQVVQMWRRRGFVCLQIAEGNF